MQRRLMIAATVMCVLTCVLLAKPVAKKTKAARAMVVKPAAPQPFAQQLRADYLKQLTLRFKPAETVKKWTQSAANSLLWKRMNSGHGKVKLSAEDKQRVLIWMDTYAQYLGSFDAAQEKRLNTLKARWKDMLVMPVDPAKISTKPAKK